MELADIGGDGQGSSRGAVRGSMVVAAEAAYAEGKTTNETHACHPTSVPSEPAPETNFTIGINHRPQSRPTHSLITSLPFCVCCLCGYDHATPDCPPGAALPISPHVCQLQTTPVDPADTPEPLPQAPLSKQDWSALHWDIWQEEDLQVTNTPMDSPTSPQDPTPPDAQPARTHKSRRLQSLTTMFIKSLPSLPVHWGRHVRVLTRRNLKISLD